MIIWIVEGKWFSMKNFPTINFLQKKNIYILKSGQFLTIYPTMSQIENLFLNNIIFILIENFQKLIEKFFCLNSENQITNK